MKWHGLVDAYIRIVPVYTYFYTDILGTAREDVVDYTDLRRYRLNGVTVNVISKEFVAQQVSKIIDKGMTHSMLLMS